MPPLKNNKGCLMNHKLYTYLPTRCRNVSTLSIILPIPSSRLPLEFTTTRVECWKLTNDFVTPLNTVPNASAMVEKRGIHNYGEINVLCLEYLNKGINCTWLINKWMKHFIHLDIMKRYSNNASFLIKYGSHISKIFELRNSRCNRLFTVVLQNAGM